MVLLHISTHRIHGKWYIYLHIYHKNQPNVGKYTIHGWYGDVWGIYQDNVHIYIYCIYIFVDIYNCHVCMYICTHVTCLYLYGYFCEYTQEMIV